MYRAIVYKEFRENVGLGLLALIAFLLLIVSMTGIDVLPWLLGRVGSIPFVMDGFLDRFGWIAGLLAAGLALRQTLMESVRGTWLFLFHRPIDRRRLIAVKMLVGLAIYLVVSAVPILVYGWWAATPGTHASPFYWSMTLPVWQLWLSLTAGYFAAFLTGVRPGRWFGSRLWPLVMAGFCVFLLQAPVFSWGLRLAGLIVVDAVLVACILFVVQTRDFS